MAVIKWDPFSEIDTFFGKNFFPNNDRFGHDLAVDIIDDEKNIMVEVAAPGVKQEELDISVENELLRIKGRREEIHEDKKKGYYCKEIHRGNFERAMRLPAPVDAQGAQAKYEDGVLRIIFPKKSTSARIKVGLS